MAVCVLRKMKRDDIIPEALHTEGALEALMNDLPCHLERALFSSRLRYWTVDFETRSEDLVR